MITNIEIHLPNPTELFFIKAPNDNRFLNEKITYKKDAEKLNEMLDSFPIGTIRELFKLLAEDKRVNK